MTAEKRDNIFGAIYRELDELADAVRKNTEALERLAQIALRDAERAVAREPEQQTLPGMPEEDWTPPDMTPPPRIWSNTVRVYDEIWRHFGKDGRPFGLAELCRDEGFLGDVIEATKGRVAPSSLSKMLSVTTRADATYTIRKGVYRCNEPTDELREAIERVAKKRKEVSA